LATGAQRMLSKEGALSCAELLMQNVGILVFITLDASILDCWNFFKGVECWWRANHPF
jgi:hypothetical protein